MVVCVLHPRLALLAALGDRRELLAEPVALAPEPGAPAYVGQASAAAEAFGIVAGMRVGEALARCPDLRLVPPDPEGVRELWSAVLDAVEGIGAAPESDLPGEAYFEAEGLVKLHRGGLEGVLAAARRALGRGMRVAAAPSRFSAYVAATLARPRRAFPPVSVAEVRTFLAPRPVELLRARPELVTLAEVLDRLGIRTLGELAELPAAAVSERFGHPGLLALDLARGSDTPLIPRRPSEPVTERIELPEAALGPQLERALELLIGRVLARSERRGRSVRALAISARFVERGTWRTAVTLRAASADPERILIALSGKLAELPAPAATLGLEVESFGPPAHDQGRLIDEHDAVRRARLGEAVHQARQAAGDLAALRVLEVDSGSRVPERRAVLAPFTPGPRPE